MSNMLSYKGYHAKVEFDADDGILVGSVFGIRDSLNFHGASIEEVKESFHDCIDTYLEICEARGIAPDKEYKGSFNVRIPQELHRRAALKAEEDGVSLNQFIQQAIEEYIKPVRYKEVIVQLPVVQQAATMHAFSDRVDTNKYHSMPSTQLS